MGTPAKDDDKKGAVRDAYVKAKTREEFEKLLRADRRVKFLSPALIFIFIRVALLLWDLWKAKCIAVPTDADFAEHLSLDPPETRES
jgi:hypothetical protein